ncbi:MAG: MBL fold metallo-hydrolase [archaeon]|nr:MAG: MBL fold metallo-hydrolase [archaeon]
MYATRVADRVYLLDTHALGVPGTVAAYLVKGPNPTLIDCGYASSYQAVLAGLEEAGVAAEEIRYLIPTHVHLDHAGAAGRLLKSMPKAEVVAHERGVPHLVDPARLMESATRVFGPAIMALYGSPDPIPAERVTSVGQERRIDLGEGLWARVVYTPGHAPHQVSVLLEGTGLVATADAVGIIYPGFRSLIPTTPPASFDPPRLSSSLESLSRMNPVKLLVPHFGVRDDPAWVIGETRRLVEEWVGKVRKLNSQGAELEEVAKELEEEVAAKEGTALPVYAQVSIRASAMGILHYLEKNP